MARLSRHTSSEGEKFWFHPNGYSIVKEERDWDLRGFPRGAVGASLNDCPKTWWEVRPSRIHEGLGRALLLRRYRPPLETFNTLTEARAWCDTNPKEAS